MLESVERAKHRILHIRRHRRGHTLQVHLSRAVARRFDKELMPLLFREANDLVLDRRAVARTGAVYVARIHRAARQVRADYVVRALVRVDDVTRRAFHAAQRILPRPPRKRQRLVVAGLQLQRVEVDRPAVDSDRRARLKPSERHAEPLKARRQPLRRQRVVRPGFVVDGSYVDSPREIRSRAYDRRRNVELLAERGSDLCHALFRVAGDVFCFT